MYSADGSMAVSLDVFVSRVLVLVCSTVTKHAKHYAVCSVLPARHARFCLQQLCLTTCGQLLDIEAPAGLAGWG